MGHAVITHNESDDVVVTSHDAECNGLQSSTTTNDAKPSTTTTNDAKSNASSIATIAVPQCLPLDSTTATSAARAIASRRLPSLPLNQIVGKYRINSFYLIIHSKKK